MKRDIHIAVKWFMNEKQVSELTFNFYNSANELVGYVDIDAKGNMRWQIVNLEYKDYFFNVLPYLYNDNINDRLSYESVEANPLRWTRARIFIANNNILIKYSQEMNDLQEERRMSR